MSFYDPAVSQKLYEEYLRTEDESLIEKLLQSVEGLIDSVIYKTFANYDKHLQEECKQDAYLFLIDIFRNHYIRLDGNYTSFLYECIQGHLRNKIRYYYPSKLLYSGDLLEEENLCGVVYLAHQLEDLDYLEHVRDTMNSFYRELPKDLQMLCKFSCHYYLAKKELPPIGLVKEKFKLTHLPELYQKVRISIKERILKLKLEYIKGE